MFKSTVDKIKVHALNSAPWVDKRVGTRDQAFTSRQRSDLQSLGTKRHQWQPQFNNAAPLPQRNCIQMWSDKMGAQCAYNDNTMGERGLLASERRLRVATRRHVIVHEGYACATADRQRLENSACATHSSNTLKLFIPEQRVSAKFKNGCRWPSHPHQNMESFRNLTASQQHGDSIFRAFYPISPSPTLALAVLALCFNHDGRETPRKCRHAPAPQHFLC